MKPGRSKSNPLHKKRNRTLAARYYYWNDLQRRRFDDVMDIISKNEFFIGEQSINQALEDQREYMNKLASEKVQARDLKKQYPGFDWSKVASPEIVGITKTGEE